jgi:hypothetical protein
MPPELEFDGLTRNTTRAAAPGVTTMLALVLAASVPEVAISV